MIESSLLQKFGSYIDGQWRSEGASKILAVTNPVDGELLAELPSHGAGETTQAVEAAVRCMADTPSLDQRRDWLNQIADRLLEHKQELGRIITLEHGKPLREGVGETEYSAGFFRYCAEHIDSLKDQPIDGDIRGCQWVVHHRPAGVAALIVPWNFPLAMLAKKTSAAIAAGCATVTKPASLTPLSSIAFFALLDQIDLPAGFANLIIGSSGPVGDVLCTHPAVRIISFTGSTEVGKVLLEKTAPHIKRLALELGGNAPFIVFEDADLDAAADGFMVNKFRAGGQTCVCANRVYVHRAAVEPFLNKLATRIAALKVGNGLDEQTDIGPMVDRNGFDKVAQHVQDALAKGAKRLVGDDPVRPDDPWGAFYPPTLISNVTQDMLVCQDETFGPLAAVSLFDDEAEVIEKANETEYGLAAYIFTADEQRAARVIPQLRFGHVGYNTGTGPTPQAPFGGMKHSGFGREGGIEGMLEFSEAQVVARGG